jgi:hypothetical protein
LHFSDFSTLFYAIYKKQAIHFTIGVTLLQGSPRKEYFFYNVAPGRPAGAVEQNPVRLVTGLAGEGLGKGARVARGWFGSALGAELAGGEVSGGSRCGLNSGEVWAGEKEWRGLVVSLSSRGGEGPTDSTGAAQVWSLAGARPGIDGGRRGRPWGGGLRVGVKEQWRLYSEVRAS